MPSYPLPPWLSPSAAQGYGQLAGEADRAALSAQLEREQMSQRATQFAIEAQQRSQQTAAEMQARQEQLNYEHQMEQQKIAQEQAYKQAQLSLDQQQVGTAAGHLALDQKEWEDKTKQAATRFTAQQAFQKAILPKEQGGQGLSPTEAALQYMAPYMTGTELARLSAVGAPFKMGVPQDIPGFPGKKGLEISKGHYTILDKGPDPNAQIPAAIPETGKDGEVIGYWVQPPGGGPMRYQPAKAESSGDQMLKERMAKKGLGTKEAPAAAPAGDFGPQMVPPPPVRPMLHPSTAVDSGGPDLSKVTILPNKKEDLKEGILYMTSRGPAVWNGTNFVKQ